MSKSIQLGRLIAKSIHLFVSSLIPAEITSSEQRARYSDLCSKNTFVLQVLGFCSESQGLQPLHLEPCPEFGVNRPDCKGHDQASWSTWYLFCASMALFSGPIRITCSHRSPPQSQQTHKKEIMVPTRDTDMKLVTAILENVIPFYQKIKGQDQLAKSQTAEMCLPKICNV